MARSAVDLVVGDLKQEIVNGSTVSTVNGYTIYTPSSNANMVPMLSGTPSPAPTASSNMVRRSIRSDPIPNPPGVPSRASAINSTSDVSLNGRAVTAARWNKHYLIPRLTASSTAVDSTPVANFTGPDWVLVTRNGPAVQTVIGSGSTALNNATATNGNYVIGRYAYAIYEEGGLLDVNVAGYPSPTPAPSPANYVQTIGRKGSVAYADLASLPTSTATPAPSFPPLRVNDFVGWRNYASVQPTGNIQSNNFGFPSATVQNFMTLVASNTGFLTTPSTLYNGGTDQAFTSRQELIAFRTAPGDIGFSQNALLYLGTFSREYNRPTWKPATPSATNPDLTTIRVGTAFTRPDGSQAVTGEPLLKRRYPLTRLNELANTSDPNIQRDFGLQWDSANYRWNYVGASGSTVQSSIKTLAQVAAENPGREPNFFELLKAVILNGSVGLGSGPTATFIASETKYYSTAGGLSADYQIMQIGANIIDCWDSDNIPTFIGFKDPITATVYEPTGIENLPYLNKLVFCARVPNGTGQTADAWLVPSLWNPHQNGNVATSTGNRVRIALTGSPTYTAVFKVGSTTYTTNAIVTSPIPSIDVAANGFMAPTPPSDPAPAPLATAGAITSVNDGIGPEKYYGFHFAFTTPPTSTQVNKDNLDTTYPDFGSATTGNVELQVQLPNTTYKTYQKWSITATNHPLVAQGAKNNGDWTNTNKMVDPEYVALDPRTLRFGVWGSDADGQGGGTGNKRKDASYGAEDSMDEDKGKIELITWSKPQGASFTVSAAPTDLSLYATNAGSGATNHYVDLDAPAVQRHGDWTTDANGTNNKNTIMYASAKAAPAGNYRDRPQLFSAPFQSVAELGQVFRDQPWKTLAFTIANSGDAGLLDVFTLQDIPTAAGKTSLNTRQYPALAAILAQAGLRIDGSSILTTTQANNIAKAIVAITATNPMISKADLVARIAADSTVTSLNNKEARECVMRALTDASQTRTWNLMIDVIAQSGRYPPNATSFTNGFLVEAEKRYWLHIAIDRFTGEVIDQQLEAVYE